MDLLRGLWPYTYVGLHQVYLMSSLTDSVCVRLHVCVCVCRCVCVCLCVVCRSLTDGVLSLLQIGSQRATFVESLSRRLHVPLVTSSAPPPHQPITGRRHNVTSSTVLYMRPPLLASAVADVIVEYGWSQAYYVYDNSEGDKQLSPKTTDSAHLSNIVIAELNCAVAVEFGEKYNSDFSTEKLKVKQS